MGVPYPGGNWGGDLAARIVFFAECALNCISIALMLRPRHFLLQFVPKARLEELKDPGGQELFGPGAEGFVCWYMVLLIVLTYVELRALIGLYNDALVVIMEGLLLGDIAHFIAACMLARSVGGWAGANIAGACIAIFLGGWRVYFMVLRYAGEGFGVGAQGTRNFAAAKHD